MKRVLVYLKKSSLAPVGGANGYNYTLKKGLERINDSDIIISYLEGKSLDSSFKERAKNINNKKISSAINAIKSILKKGMMMYGPYHKASVNLNKYDAIHFHRTTDLYWAKDSLKKYTGKVILTLHTPTMPSKQMFSLLTDFEKKYMHWFYKKLPAIDNYAINRADYVIVACKEAEEPYYHTWDGYEMLRERNKNKYLYMPTGTEEKRVTVSRADLRKKYGIPEDAFVISYVGRHNEIKGYDNLKIIGKKTLDLHSRVWFLIAGSEGPIYHLEHERWIEVGWTKEPETIVSASDMFILPNKETYFDLVLLEVLALGQIVLASYTGGNKFFQKYEKTGMLFYKDSEEAIAQISYLLNCGQDERKLMKQANRKLFDDYFTNDAFASRYLEILHKIMD